MTRETISDALNFLEDGILQETDALRAGKGRKRRLWRRVAAAAACLALAGTAGLWAHLRLPGSAAQLPLITLSEEVSGMGFEGYMAYDAAELVNANPWREDMRLSTLPVYRNRLAYDENGIAQGADFAQMQDLLRKVAARLGLDADTLPVADNAPDETTRQKITEKLELAGGSVPEGYFNPTALIADAEGIHIEVSQQLTAKISLDPAVPLPEGYRFTHFASYEELAETAEYLKSTYQDLLAMENPQLNLHGGDYDLYLQQRYQIEFFDGSRDERERLINYNFNRVAFYCDDAGELFLIRIFRPDLSEKVGDYPVITVQEAKELLAAGHYSTSVPYEMPGIDFVAGAELVYRTGGWEHYFLPYYRFYVELPEAARENGLKTYGAYYVPAVEGTYIANMPVWDGSFNG